MARMDSGSLALQKRVSLGQENYAYGIAFGAGAVWVVDAQKNLVFRIDPARNRVVAQIKVESGISSDDIAVGGGAVWIADTQTGRVVRIDPEHEPRHPAAHPRTSLPKRASWPSGLDPPGSPIPTRGRSPG